MCREEQTDPVQHTESCLFQVEKGRLGLADGSLYFSTAESALRSSSRSDGRKSSQLLPQEFPALETK
ncbi:unnamed protein product, partial [Gadus morhua 'NCC']